MRKQFGLFLSLFAALALALLLAPGTVAQATPTPLATPEPSEAAEAATAVVETGGPRLRVRQEPSLTAPIVARLNDGSVVHLRARDGTGDWVLVALPNASAPLGWVALSYLREQAPSPPMSTPAPAVITATATVAALPMITATVAVSEAMAPAAPPGLYGKLAVPVFDEERNTYDVWLVNADGSDLRRVAEQASSPALSHDGTMLAYRRWQVDDRGIVVANADGVNPLRITDKLEDVLPSFSPDRSKVAFSTYRWGDRKNRLYYAWSDEQKKVAWEWGNGGIFGEDPYWATDGRIFFRVTRPDRAVEELWSMDGRSGENRTLWFMTPSIRAPAVDPDNRTVAYMALDGDDWDLYTLDLNMRTVTQVTDDKAQDGLPAFSPSGEYIAFVSDRSGEWALYRMDRDGGNVRLISLLPGSVDGRVAFEPDYLNHGWLEEQIAWSW